MRSLITRERADAQKGSTPVDTTPWRGYIMCSPSQTRARARSSRERENEREREYSCTPRGVMCSLTRARACSLSDVSGALVRAVRLDPLHRIGRTRAAPRRAQRGPRRLRPQLGTAPGTMTVLHEFYEGNCILSKKLWESALHFPDFHAEICFSISCAKNAAIINTMQTPIHCRPTRDFPSKNYRVRRARK